MEGGDDPPSSSSSSCACGGINSSRNNNKRKFQDGILVGVQKYKNAKTTSTNNTTQEEEEETCFPSNNIIQLADIKLLRNMRKEASINNSNGATILIHSAKDSNSFSEDADSFMSVSVSDDDSKNNQQQYLKICPSSVNWSGSSVNSFDTKACSNNLYPCPSFEEEDEFTTTSSGYESKQSVASMEDLFYSSNGKVVVGGEEEGLVSTSFLLSSGRWNINQDTEQGTEKLTIDKEFEQYFSMLML